MSKLRKDKDYRAVVKNKNIPILTLDVRWHETISYADKTKVIRRLEKSVNNLLKEQGKLINDIKDMKKLKKKLMNEIVDNMDTSDSLVGKEREKILIKNEKYLNELNDNIKESMDRLAELPYRIKEENEKLMVESAKVCYNKLNNNNYDIKELTQLTEKLRKEVIKETKKKENLETESELIYSYMHDMLGAGAMEQLDL